MCVCVCVCDLYKCTLVDTDELGRALRAPERRGTVQILISIIIITKLQRFIPLLAMSTLFQGHSCVKQVKLKEVLSLCSKLNIWIKSCI